MLILKSSKLIPMSTTSSISAPLLSQPDGAMNAAKANVPGTQKDSRVHKAAQQFEALMIGEMMKTVREGGEEGWLGSGEGTGDDTAIGMAESQFSQAMASNGGLGLAHMIETTVSRQQGGHTEKAAPEKLLIGPR